MSRRRGGRGRIVNGSESPTQKTPARAPSERPALTPVSPTTHFKVNAPLPKINAFKAVVERAADMLKNEVASTGPVCPTAIFFYENETENRGASTMNAVSLHWTSDLHKEALIRRIREKTITEHASAVLMLTEAEPRRVHGSSRSPAQRQGRLILSGVTPEVSLSARVDYTFDKETKRITFWEMHWLDRPVQNLFLDGVFEKTAGAEELQPGDE